MTNAENDGRASNISEEELTVTYVRRYYMDLHGDAHEDRRSLITRVFHAKE